MNRVVFKETDHSFINSVKKAVDEYFYIHNLKKTGNWNLYIKALLFIPLAVFLYIFLLFGSYSALAGIVLSISFGLSLSIIAVNVMHDACHGSFSGKKWINTLMGLTMNVLGSNAFLWKIKHNNRRLQAKR